MYCRIHKKARQCLGLLRKFWSFNISTHILTMVYGRVIYVSCYGNLTVKQKNKLSHVISQTNKITEQKQNTLQDLFSHFMEKNGNCNI